MRHAFNESQVDTEQTAFFCRNILTHNKMTAESATKNVLFYESQLYLYISVSTNVYLML